MTDQHITAKVVARKDFTNDLFCLWLKPETESGKPFDFKFKPGQYCTIGMEGILRPYSIASAPHEEHIELFVELVPKPHGNLTPLLHQLKVGDSIDLLPKAKGIFTLDPGYKRHVMVATVTGVAPYVSILRDFLYRSLHFKLSKEEVDSSFYILQGASYRDEFGYYDELFDLESTCPLSDMTVIYAPTISRPNEARNAGWEHQETGRVNIVAEDFLSKLYYISPAKTLVYACGHPGMIEDIKARLLPRGWKIKEERFWKE